MVKFLNNLLLLIYPINNISDDNILMVENVFHLWMALVCYQNYFHKESFQIVFKFEEVYYEF